MRSAPRSDLYSRANNNDAQSGNASDGRFDCGPRIRFSGGSAAPKKGPASSSDVVTGLWLFA